jgi:hypothetical protein
MNHVHLPMKHSHPHLPDLHQHNHPDCGCSVSTHSPDAPIGLTCTPLITPTEQLRGLCLNFLHRAPALADFGFCADGDIQGIGPPSPLHQFSRSASFFIRHFKDQLIMHLQEHPCPKACFFNLVGQLQHGYFDDICSRPLDGGIDRLALLPLADVMRCALFEVGEVAPAS